MECSVLGARDETTEHLYFCGAVTEVLKIGTSFKQHSGSSLKTPPKLLFLIIPGQYMSVG